MRYFNLVFFLVVIAACQSNHSTERQEITSYNMLGLDTFAVPASVRALQVVNEQEIWFAGSPPFWVYPKTP